MSDPVETVKAAWGFIELGLFEDAAEELDSLPAEFRVGDDVMEARIGICQRLEKWNSARVLAQSLAGRSPENPVW